MPHRPVSLIVAAVSLVLTACAPGSRGPAAAAAEPAPAPGAKQEAPRSKPAPPPDRPGDEASGALPREANPDDPLCAPLLIEADFGFGTHVVMRRLPTGADLEDLRFISGLRQVLVALPQWPATYSELRPLQQAILPEGAELVVLLPGWPPTREALGAWNLIGGNLRLILVVDGPPADRALISELNHVRPLERVIADRKSVV